MNIAIIGTGNVGSALGGPAPRRPATTSCSPPTTPPRPRPWRPPPAPPPPPRAREAVAGADIVVLAVPYGAVAAVAAEIAPVAAGKIVIDPTNPLKADYSGLATGGGTSGAEQLARLLPGRKVVKAFNTVFAGNAAQPAGARLPARRALRHGRRGGQGRRLRPRPLHRLPPGPRRPAGRGPRARGPRLAQHPPPAHQQRQLEHRLRRSSSPPEAALAA